MHSLHSPARASLLFIIITAGLGCPGSLMFSGALWLDDDDSADDDDTTANDDDSADDDDDTTPGDDDDDSVGGPVSCGPEVQPGSEWAGLAANAVTGSAEVRLEHGERGGFFSGAWSGCEARHYFDETGAYVCGVRWAVLNAPSYGEQYQPSQLVSRFQVDWIIAENTCGAAFPAANRPRLFYRLTVPYAQGTMELRVSENEQVVPAQMQEWATLPWDGGGDQEPTDVDFEYATGFAPTE